MQKISVIGNSGGGKTKLSQALAERYRLPLVHVDNIQFLSGLKIRPHQESIQVLLEKQRQPAWIIDGFGPLDILIERLQASDKVIFIDLPLWRHVWWLCKRQFLNIFSPRKELPEGCNEISVGHTVKLFQSLVTVHQQMRPEMLRILSRENLKGKVIFIRNLKQWKQIYTQGF
jgi:hypothetical protein